MFRNFIFKTGEQFDFDIHPYTGVISSTSCIDREHPRYIDGRVTLNIVAENALSDVRLNDTAIVTVIIEDVNDNAPVFEQDVYEEYLGFLSSYDDLITVSAVDEDMVSKVSFTRH